MSSVSIIGLGGMARVLATRGATAAAVGTVPVGDDFSLGVTIRN